MLALKICAAGAFLLLSPVNGKSGDLCAPSPRAVLVNSGETLTLKTRCSSNWDSAVGTVNLVLPPILNQKVSGHSPHGFTALSISGYLFGAMLLNRRKRSFGNNVLAATLLAVMYSSICVHGSQDITTMGASHTFGGSNVAVATTGSVAIASGSLSGECTDTGAGKATGAAQAAATGSHCYKNVNDGQFGNLQSWIGGSGTQFVGIVLPSAKAIVGFAIGRDQEGQYSDRWSGTKTFEVTSAANPSEQTSSWTQVGATFTMTSSGRHVYSFGQSIAGVMGIRLNATNVHDCIDELQVYEEISPTAISALLPTLTQHPTSVEFSFHTTPKSWHDARTHCLSIGGGLASIHNDEPNVDLHQLRGGVYCSMARAHR